MMVPERKLTIVKMVGQSVLGCEDRQKCIPLKPHEAAAMVNMSHEEGWRYLFTVLCPAERPGELLSPRRKETLRVVDEWCKEECVVCREKGMPEPPWCDPYRHGPVAGWSPTAEGWVCDQHDLPPEGEGFIRM